MSLYVHTFLVILLASGMADAQAIQRDAHPLASMAKDQHHTKITLLADVKSIKPGTRFSVGLLMNMDDGWHTYWKNAGEAGLPTQITWTLPAGFSAGEIQWPLPHKYNESGEVVTYGYEKENLLLVPMTATVGVKTRKSISLRAEVSWLECERVCIPATGTVTITLPVTDDQPATNNETSFSQYRRQVPNSSTTEFSLRHETRGAEVWLSLNTSGTGKLMLKSGEIPDFYPETLGNITVGRTQVAARETDVQMHVRLSAYEHVKEADTLRGIVVYQMEPGTRKAVEVAIPLSKEFCSNLPISGEGGVDTGVSSSTGILDKTFVTVPTGGAQMSLTLYIIFAIIGGLLLNIMPCVLPVISLKIFGFVRMAGDHPQQVKKLGWFFSAGILASFLVLAVLVIILQAAGEQVGWGFQFQSPLFVIAMSTVVFAFGLSLFGVYEVSLPFMLAFVGLGSSLEHRGKEYAASFFEGVFATILATPCTAPFLGTALGFAFTQPAWVILLIFTCVALGMALPYLVLTAKPAWMKFLPKPGEWMVTAKQFMGFLMMATLIWLLYILGKQLGMEAVIWTSAFLLTIGIACWVIGRFATLNVTRTKYLVTWWIAAAIIVGGYWYFLENTLDVRRVIAGLAPTAQEIVGSDPNAIQWQTFTIAGLDSHIRDNKTILIDFTADWCLTCKVNEKTVLTNRSIVEQVKAAGIIALKADWTNRNPEITKLLAKFGRSGVPLYVVFPAGRPEAPIVLPEVITPDILKDALKKALMPV